MKQSQFYISPDQAKGLIFMSRMSTLTADQFMLETGQSKRHTSDFLRTLYRHKLLGRGGGLILDGNGRKPFIYWLSNKGHKYLCNEEGLADRLGEYRSVQPRNRWPLQMDHRLATIDIIQSLKHGLAKQKAGFDHIALDWQQEKRFGKMRASTTDYVSEHFTEANKLVPDATVSLLHPKHPPMLIFIECDRGTENIGGSASNSIIKKLQNYDRYFKSGRFRETYKDWHKYKGCSLFFVTTTFTRIKAIRAKARNLDPAFHDFMMLTTHEHLARSPLSKIWATRNESDKQSYRYNGSV